MRLSFSETCEKLDEGGVVALPTETVYGLAAKASNTHAIKQIFTLKKRPANNPLIVHLATSKQLGDYVEESPPGTAALIKHFWPGPLTLIFTVIPSTIPSIVRAGLPTAAFRIPEHPLIQQVLSITGPLVAPSANRSGRPSATRAKHVEEDFGEDFPILDGGPCQTGVESTILVFKDNCWQIARLGALAPETLKPHLGYLPAIATSRSADDIICPGRLHRHYAPKAHLTLSSKPYDGSAPVVLGFEGRVYPNAQAVLTLSSSEDPEKALKQLYASLRQLDTIQAKNVWVDMNFPHTGLWLTLHERLERASSSQTT